jgi:hypothetical protein
MGLANRDCFFTVSIAAAFIKIASPQVWPDATARRIIHVRGLPSDIYMRSLAVFFLTLGLASTQAPELTNQDVTEMTKAGLSASVIVAKISSAPCHFDTSVAALTSLKASGVDDSVLSAMIGCRPAPAPSHHDKPHVWVGANEEWIAYGSHTTVATSNSQGTAAAETGNWNATAQTRSEYADVTRALSDKCPDVVITNNVSDADYALTIERYHAGHLLTQRNRFSIVRARDDKLILSNKTTWLKNAANDICTAILQDTPSTVVSRPSLYTK